MVAGSRQDSSSASRSDSEAASTLAITYSLLCGTARPPLVDLDPISIVCKVTSVDGRPAVKLSDNPEKATGAASEVERYLRVFGDAGRVRTAVHV